MKINRLSVQGFGPYKTLQHVDFDAFDDDGIFLMGGKTGAGKSSILDAICFALYDSVPRYEGTKARLRSDHCAPEDPSLVTLEFTAGGTRYKVERSPEYERAKKGDRAGTVLQKSTAVLSELRGEAWHGIAAGPREVGPQIAELVGLNKDQFLQVILLAQNRFQQFLLAKSEARQEVLRSLFGTRRFQDYELTLTEQRKALETELGTRRATLQQMLEQAASTARAAGVGVGEDTDTVDSEPDVEGGADAASDGGAVSDTDVASDGGAANDGATAPAAERAVAVTLETPEELSRATIEPWLTTLGEAAASCLGGADSASATANARFLAADKAHDDLLSTHAAQQRRTSSERTLELLLAEAEVLLPVRAEIAAAGRAEVVWGALQGSRRAAESAMLLNEKLATAHTAFARIRTPSEDPQSADSDSKRVGSSSNAPDAVELAAVIDESTRERGSLKEGLATELALPGQRVRLDEYASQRATAETDLATALERSSALPALVENGTAQLTELRVGAARADEAAASIERLQRAQSARSAAEKTEVKLATARANELAAGQSSTRASAVLDELRAARLTGHAAELAAELRDGEPCAVCGATEHLSPATAEGRVVRQIDIDEAAAELELRQNAAREASAAATTLAEKLAEQRGLAGGRTSAELDLALTEARANLTTATDAATAATRLAEQLDAQRAEQAAAESTVSTLRDALSTATELHTAARTRLDSDEKRVAELRAEHESVAARDDAVSTLLTHAHALADALVAATAATTTAAATAEELTVQLAAHGFASAIDVEEAHLTTERRSALELRITTHDESLAGAKAVLADPALAELPREPVEPELEQSAARLDALTLARDQALTMRATIAGQARSLEQLRNRVEAELAASASLIERFEVVSRLAATLEGKAPNDRRMKLESYVLAAELEQIVEAANGRLGRMSGGRYTLEHDDSIGYRGTQSGLGLSILDSHTGLQRATHSLSGGEMFLASLALALGLAEVVTSRAGGIRLDTLFIDEGFGSLDADTLEIAMATLDGLRTGGRTIGLISHVEAMKEQIHASLQVRVSEQGWSTISQSEAAP